MTPRHRDDDGVQAVAIGGGHGTARTLQALNQITDQVTAVVTVADDGGSSGRLRRDLQIAPPGDLRMALTAMATDERYQELFTFRFDRGELAGHSLGNLILAALHELSERDLILALQRCAAMLGVSGQVLPCTTTPITLGALTPEGKVSGQVAVAATPRLQRVWIEPGDPEATPDAVRAIAEADLVVLGPGSLYTSLLPNLLVPGIAAALASCRAKVVFIANLREQPGETEGLRLVDHLDAVRTHVPEVRIDVVMAHQGPPPSGSGAPLSADAHRFHGWPVQIITTDLLDGADGHDPAKLAEALRAVVGP